MTRSIIHEGNCWPLESMTRKVKVRLAWLVCHGSLAPKVSCLGCSSLTALPSLVHLSCVLVQQNHYVWIKKSTKKWILWRGKADFTCGLPKASSVLSFKPCVVLMRANLKPQSAFITKWVVTAALSATKLFPLVRTRWWPFPSWWNMAPTLLSLAFLSSHVTSRGW